MKKRFLLFGLIFALATVMSHAQIVQVFSQDFETGTPVNYTVSSATSAAPQTSIVSGGSRSMKITHTQSNQVIMTLDTIDLSFNATLSYFTLEFQQIAFVDPRQGTHVSQTALIEVKRPDQSNWISLNQTHYNRADGGSNEFLMMGTFSQESYADWSSASAANNTLWKSERFDLDAVFLGAATADKKLEIRFVLSPRAAATNPNQAWFLDDIKVRASSMPIVTPSLVMRSFPDYNKYPSSRGAKLLCDVTTTVAQGINGDSVFCVYRVGNRSTLDTTFLHRIAPGSTRFEGRIPFYGYDTVMRYHLAAKDSTVNNNTVFFPRNSSQWLTYRCVRGKDNSDFLAEPYTDNPAFPFPAYEDNRSEFIYDSTTMATLGFGPGYIKTLQFKLSSSLRNVTRPHLQIRMANVANTHTRTADNDVFSTIPMQIVYDTALLIEQAAAGSIKAITLQDTFFYAGSDIVMQVYYDGPGTSDPPATPVKHVPTTTNKRSLFMDGHSYSYNMNAFGSDADNFVSGTVTNTRPWIRFFSTKNIPLVYDCGISSLAYPSYDVPSNVGTDSVVVWLKNFGALELDSCGIYYQVDGGAIVGPVQWTGHLSAGDSVRVTLSTNQNFTVGYHTMRSWVGDYLKTHEGMVVRDHEPYNDTTFSPFASCDGPYSGTRTIGTGASAHFASLDKCLYTLSRCGIDGPLTIKLPAGVYDVTTFPFIPGTSAANYVQFEPATATAQVTFRRTRRGVSANAPILADLTAARSIRFKNIRFSNGTYADNRCNVLVRLGRVSSNCQFLNCTFVDSNAVTASAQSLLNSGYADSLLVKNCTFYGGTIGIDCNGPAADVRSNNNTIQFNDFADQVNTAIRVVNQNHVLVDSNYCNDVKTNASYVILGQYCYNGSRIVRNRVFNTKGACCIGVSDYYGTASEYSVVANNMVVSLDDGTTNMLTTPLNIIKGAYIKAVFNSVRMSANDRVNVAAATFGGDVISNSYFQNNVVAAFDTSNYAFSFVPGDNESTLHVDHNCYYSVSGVLNKLTGVNYTSLNQWRSAVPSDLGSVVGNPNFTNSSISRVDLRSFNELLRNVGTPIPEVTNDIEGTTRNATAPSLGAYEVSALSIDFTPVEFVTPLEDYCGAPASIPVEVAIRNTGTGTYTYSASAPIRVYYSIDNGAWQNFNITNRNVGPLDTIHFLSTRTMALPCNTNNTDRTYNIRWYVKCSLDPDDLNDTSNWTVISRFAPAAPTTINQNVAYGNTATITPTAGVQSWPISYYTSGNGRQQRSGISWYSTNDYSSKFYYGPSYTTEPLYADTTFYISQKRNLPLVKITEVQVNRTAAGVTFPMPGWMNSGTAFAVELTNCGDYPADLEGDSILVVQPTAAAKIWVLPRVTIQPGENLVLQFKTSTTPSDSTRTIYAPSAAVVSPGYTTNFGVIYRDGNGVADAVAFNNCISASSTQPIRWGNQNIPTAVWQGNAIDLAKNGNTTNTPTAGARRIAWPTNAATAGATPTATLWQVATTSNLMHIGETEANLIRYTDNGCEGAMGQVNIHVTGVPSVDLCVNEIFVDTGCNLSTAEPVVAKINNYGSCAVNNLVVKYSLNGGVTVACSDTIASLGIRSSVNHVFSQPLNMHANSDTTYCLKVWVDALSNDVSHLNDTLDSCFFSAFSPNLPCLPDSMTVNYGERLTITAGCLNPNTYVVWSNSHHQVIDTTSGVYQTPIVYHRDTVFYRAIALRSVNNTHIGTLTSTTNNNYPSPYNPKTRYVKEQYIYTAEQIRAAGHQAGTISAISFNLAAMGANVNNFTFSDFTIKIGTTTASTFANTTYLTGLTQVYHSDNLTLDGSSLGWVEHMLDTPYNWDGTSNLVIEVVRALNTTGISAGANTKYTTQANTVLTKQHASNNMANETTAGNRGGNRPDILFGFLEPLGCQSATEGMVRIGVDNVPAVDASLQFDPMHDTVLLASCDTSTINVVLTNMGNDNLGAYTLRYKIDNGAWQQTTGNAGSLPLGYSRNVPLLSTYLGPGRHTITGVVSVAGDTITSNDTIRRTFNVRFCAGTYTIGTCSGSDFGTMTAALDTLHNAGVAGHVIFDLCPQTFNEQLSFGHVPGSGPDATITFRTQPGSSDMAKITYVPTQARNYVVDLNGVTYTTFDSLYFYANYTATNASQIYANVARVSGSQNVSFRNSVLRSKKTSASNVNANVLLLGSENHYITVNRCVIDSGYYGVRSQANTLSDNISITNSQITGFWFQGVYLRNTDTVTVSGDSIASGVTVAGKPLTGIYLANAYHANVQRNVIRLYDAVTGGKRGITIIGCRGTNLDRVNLYNNAISIKGSATASLVSSGIWVDSLSKYVNVLYNSARVDVGVNQPTTRAFSVQNSSQVHVLNNIWFNNSKGWASYVAIDTCVANVNFNNYFSTAQPNANTGIRFFVHYNTVNYASLDSLCAHVNNVDINSHEFDPGFFADDNLRLRVGLLAGRAQYNPDITTDCWGNIRPQIPQPTIGCYEFNAVRVTHDVVVCDIVDPYMPAVTTGNNAEVVNIETDKILVTAKFYNHGTADQETGCTWYAYLADVFPEVRSLTHNLPPIGNDSCITDTVYLESPLGIQDTQRVVVVINMPNDVTDARPEDNRDTVDFFIYPAYDLQLRTCTDSLLDAHGCRKYAEPFKYNIKNVGYKDFPGDAIFCLGYDFYCSNPASQSFPNIPGTGEFCHYTFGSALPVGIERTVVLDPADRPDLYPHGYNDDVTLRFRGWVKYEYDVKNQNDTTAYANVTSNHTPVAPDAHDTALYYGSYGNLYATETSGATNNKHFALHWTRDTVNVHDFYYKSNYAQSTHWNTTPQYFHDSTYYIYSVSDKGCTSYYSPINVTILPPLNCDVSINKVISPRASGRVFLEKDTVKLRLVNYGSQPVSNIPIHFKWMNANGRTTYLEVSDTVRHTIPGRTTDNEFALDTFVYVFDTALLNVNNPLPSSATSYTLNAWVSHPNDQYRGNDTLRTIHSFKALPQSTYDSILPMVPNSTVGFDITRVSFNELENIMPDMVGYDHLNLGSYTASQAEVPTLYVRAGTEDTLSVCIANNDQEWDTSTEASVCVVIDYNRDGRYGFETYENLTRDTVAHTYAAVVKSRHELQIPVTIKPNLAQYGYMRMLVWVDEDPDLATDGLHSVTDHSNGQMQEYLVYVQEDCMLDTVDAALTRVAAPRDHIIVKDTNQVEIMLANKGLTNLTSAEISYSFSDGIHVAQTGTVNWMGLLEPGKSTNVQLDPICFYRGTTNLTCVVNVPGDTFHVDNNTLNYQYHYYDTIELRFIDTFDQIIDKWYTPVGYNNYTRNYWDRTVPTKTVITTAYSQPNAYVTDGSQTIVTGKHGNCSYLYSPIINIRRIKADTLSFMLSQHLINESFLRLEYRDWEGRWQVVEDPSIRWGVDDNNSWYDAENQWTGANSQGAYILKVFSTRLISGNFGQDVQFRFVYRTPVAAAANAAFGDGAAIDDFRIGRARRSCDVGVTQITYPTAPQFGQTVYPRAIIHNYGTDPIHDFQVGYTSYGQYLADEDICHDTIEPDGDFEFEFTHPFIITNIYPDTFQICAFTHVNSDIYYDNDTTCTLFGLAPLQNDLYMYDILSPLASAVAGDSLNVTVRLRNFGQNEIDSCRVGFVYNNGEEVIESINFQDYLGRNLGSTEFFNYTFRKRVRATMGTMTLKTQCYYRNDTYPYNDVKTRSIAGIANITDLQATMGLIDTSVQNSINFEIVIDNVGARVANNFRVGYWYDDNPETLYEETFYRDGGIHAGQRVVHRFTQSIGARTAELTRLTVFLSCPGDTNQRNDTTDYVGRYTKDVSVDYVEVEETRADKCRARVAITNRGTNVFFSAFDFNCYINQSNVRRQVERLSYFLSPGETMHFLFQRSSGEPWYVTKDPDHRYTGAIQFLSPNTDDDASNNQTTDIRVVYHFEDTPEAMESQFYLEQNYPNPVLDETTIGFTLPYAGNARFFVSDIVGRPILEHTKLYTEGRNVIKLDRKQLPAGVYYYGVEFEGERRMHKMIVK